MEQEIILFTKPEELIKWVKENDLPYDIFIEDAGILLGYLEGHDYAIGHSEDGVLYRKDMGEENGEIEVYTMDEVIDIVCEWNYEKILEADAGRNKPKDSIDYTDRQSEYERLKVDEIRLDRLFEMTHYASEIEALAVKLANEFIENMNHKQGIDTAVRTVSEGIQQHSTGNRGR
ncbi:hypothetical protein [Bacteroides sp.]|uniref:hypothetical protein n=1 Tax=Bacteroides sp. TaxID=29523 RepID=UPI00261CA781|nr:hypothetical protein [Bacteroides sp.]MDD3040628.1 hypothetical protein [Bacteroides sp.]